MGVTHVGFFPGFGLFWEVWSCTKEVEGPPPVSPAPGGAGSTSKGREEPPVQVLADPTCLSCCSCPELPGPESPPGLDPGGDVGLEQGRAGGSCPLTQG